MHRHFWRFRERRLGRFLWFACDCGSWGVRDDVQFWGKR